MIHQYKGLEALIKAHPLSKADPLNGIEWKGVIQFRAAAGREFAHDERPAGKQGTRSSRKMDVWSEWREPNLAAYTIPLQKKNGTVTITRRAPGETSPVDCAAVPR